MDKKYHVGVVTSNRADYGVLLPLLKRINNQKSLELILFVTGSHLSQDFGKTEDEIINDGFGHCIKIPMDLGDNSRTSMPIIAGYAMVEFSHSFASQKLDLLIILGDRFEMLSAAVTANFLNIPIAHISGGDVTTGAIDDAIRHSITKLSYLHFPGCEQSRKRIIQMGESPNRVFNVGELGVENCLHMPHLSKKELFDSLSFKGVLEKYAIVTFHPETLKTKNENLLFLNELIKALDFFPNLYFIITYSNFDSGGKNINMAWEREALKHDNWLVVPSLGVQRYVSLLKYAIAVIGNSSSGIIEAPAFNVPTVNIGNRQNGRMMSKSVICCKATCDDIINSINKAIDNNFLSEISKSSSSFFGNGNTSSLIFERIMSFLNNKPNNFEKKFYDIDFDCIGE